MSVIDTAIQWAVDIANDDSHTYSQAVRWGPSYDCSSFVISAYTQAGLNVKGAGATYTGNMAKAFMQCGFKDVKNQVNLLTGSGLIKGDVLLNSEKHAALVQRDGGTTVEAWCTKGGIVANKTYRNDGWDYVLRYPEITTQSVTSAAPPATGTVSGVSYGQNADQVLNSPKYITYKPYFEKYGKKWNIDPNLLAALAMQESGLTDVTTGPARGVMQIEYILCENPNEGMPDGWFSFASFGKAKYGVAWTLDDRNDKDKAIEYAAWLLDKSITYYNGDLRKAIQSYNYSHYTVDALVKSYGDAWFTSGRAVKAREGYGDGQYVEHVLRYWRPNDLRGRYASPDELYMYSENSVSTEEKEATVVWNNRTAENIFRRLQDYPVPMADGELRVYANGNDITKYIGEHSWVNNQNSLSTTMSFTTAKTDAKYMTDQIYVPGKSDIIQMTTDKEIYRGVIISVDDGDREHNSYSVVDLGWYLNKSKQTYQFKGITVKESIKEVCRDLSINIVMIPELDAVVNKIYFDQSISDIISDLLSLCSGEYNYDFTPQGLRIYTIGDLIANPTFMLASNLEIENSVECMGGLSHSTSIENLKNSVKIVSEKDSVYTELLVLQDRESIDKNGFLQEIVKIDVDKDNAETTARDYLNNNNRETEKYSFDIIESMTGYTRAGECLTINGAMYVVSTASHSIKGGFHYVKLDVTRTNG